MILTGAEIIVKLLEDEGIKTVTGIPGGATLPLYNALHKSNIIHVLARHEQGAGFISQGMARSTGKPAVTLATSGPGATNLITAIADAYLDSVPLIAITGQVPLSLMGTDAFQEVDTYGLTLPITKHNFLIRNISELMDAIPLSFHLATSGRPGPVVIDVPKNIQQEKMEVDIWKKPEIETESYKVDNEEILSVAEKINSARRPVLYVGGGVISSGASSLLRELSHKNSIPVSTTLMGLGSFPSDDPLNTGMLGMHGERYTNMLINDADLLLACGVRFGDRTTGKIEEFCSHGDIIQIDIDRSEIDKIKKTNLSIMGDISHVLERLIPHVKTNRRVEWLSHLAGLRQQYQHEKKTSQGIWHPKNIIREMSYLMDPDTIITTDVGQHQMWVAQAYRFKNPRTFLTSGGLGTMGFGLPAAIGASIANPEKQVVCFSGDGSILMNIQELATLADYNLNVKIVIMNNSQLGLVRQQQEFFYEKNYIATSFKTSPDFAAIGKEFGIKSYNLEKQRDPVEFLSEVLLEQGPVLINIPISSELNVTPMVPPGSANIHMIGGETDEQKSY
jgi:acetolactate synthase-1/2/3 large subunit